MKYSNHDEIFIKGVEKRENMSDKEKIAQVKTGIAELMDFVAGDGTGDTKNVLRSTILRKITDLALTLYSIECKTSKTKEATLLPY
jgi:microcystin degradation protein MlrC